MLEARRFVIREQVRLLKSRHRCEILDGDTGGRLGLAEEVLTTGMTFFRWFISQRLMTMTLEVREEPDLALVFTVTRGSYLIRSRFEIHDAMGSLLGYFQPQLFSLGGGLRILDAAGQPVAVVQGDFFGRNYSINLPDSSIELGRVRREWQGLARELFSMANSYAVELSPDLDGQPLRKMLLLAAALVIDISFKSRANRADRVDRTDRVD